MTGRDYDQALARRQALVEIIAEAADEIAAYRIAFLLSKTSSGD